MSRDRSFLNLLITAHDNGIRVRPSRDGDQVLVEVGDNYLCQLFLAVPHADALADDLKKAVAEAKAKQAEASKQ
ncbi:hypothetical protein [Nocardia wallacei]|uniref:hypothetical protein n=1 Tax=Nocardia wallacei TaxID=480035 RepID=UPI002458B5D9|nr:hypothetical protein [Nocardia wallacei]